MGLKSEGLIKGVETCVKNEKLDFKFLNNVELAKKYPAFNLTSDFVAYEEEQAGVIFPENFIKACVTLATNSFKNAVLKTKVKVKSYEVMNCGNIKVLTENGE